MDSESPPPQHLRTWFMTPLEVDDAIEEFGYVDSSDTWNHFAALFNSRGYFFISPDDEGRSPQLETSAGLGDPFSPTANGPFIHHVPAGLNSLVEETHGGPWRSSRPKVTFAYDSLFRIVVIKAIVNSKISELEILSFLNQPKFRGPTSWNHTIPIIEIIHSDEGWPFVIMPAWKFPLEDLRMIWQVDEYFALIIQSLEGLSFMHENGVAHRDISLTNMVLNHDGTQREYSMTIPYPFLSNWDFRLAYIDFDLASRYSPGTDTSTWVDSGFHGNFMYAAPENIASHETGAKYAVLPTDIYSLGKVWDTLIKSERQHLVEIRRLREYSNPTRAFANNILEYHVPQLEKYLLLMMDVEPSKRPTANEALQWFKVAREEVPSGFRFSPVEGYPLEYVQNVDGFKENRRPRESGHTSNIQVSGPGGIYHGNTRAKKKISADIGSNPRHGRAKSRSIGVRRSLRIRGLSPSTPQ